MAINIIETSEQLKKLIEILQNDNVKVIALDTEFCRESTFKPVLGLIQLCFNKEIYLIDSIKLIENNDIYFKDFIDYLVHTEAMVVLHACTEDNFIIADYATYYGLDRRLPKNMFDTQLAACFLGIEPSIGLAAMLKQFIGIELEKSQTRTNWLARPLTDAQIEYAALDVSYLEQVMILFNRMFQDKPTAHKFFLLEMKELSEKIYEVEDTNSLHINLSGCGQFSVRKLRMLNAICNLRYEICKKENMALSWFLKNRVIVKLVDTSIMDPSTYIPKGVHYSIAKKYGQLIAKTARKALNDESIPYVPTYEAVKNVKSVVAEMDALEKYLIESAKKLCIPKEIICSKRLILDFFYHCLFTPNKLSILEEGWRGEFLSGLRMFKDKFAVRQ